MFIFRRVHPIVLILAAFLLSSGCTKKPDLGKDIEIEIEATLNGAVVGQASVLIDGVEEGKTDEKGHFSKIIKRRPGMEVSLAVDIKKEGYSITPWKETFVVKEPKGEAPEKYLKKAVLESEQFITVSVSETGGPVVGAEIHVEKEKAGESDESGKYTYSYKKQPVKGFNIRVTKKGYASWEKTVQVKAGEVIDISLSRQILLTFKALTEEYGLSKGIPDVQVSIDGKAVGKTNADGAYTYTFDGEVGKKAEVSLDVPEYFPSKWESQVSFTEDREIRRYFYSAKARPIKVAVHGYVVNSPDESVESARGKIETSVKSSLFAYESFKEFSVEDLAKGMKKEKTDVKTMTSKGWQKTGLSKTLDMLILGSVAKGDDGFIFETNVYTSDGKLLLSRIGVAGKESQIPKVAKKLAEGIVEKFPFEGTIIGSEGKRHKVNLGKTGYSMASGMEFDVKAADMDRSGKVKGYTGVGTLEVKKAEKDASWVEVMSLKSGVELKPGTRVVRRVYTEEETAEMKNSVDIAVKGGVDPKFAPLPSVNIYLNGEWAGSTDMEGLANVPFRLGKTYEIILYRHGYNQVSDEFNLRKDKETKEFTLTANNAMFKVESDPSGAEVFVDDEDLGATPFIDGKPVNFGFHKVRISAKGDYRDWEKVTEFREKIVDFSGANRIALLKDYMAIGRRAEKAGNPDEAINAYRSVEKEHPDYSDAHNNLARIYMDEKGDFDSAIAEFDKVFAVPENRELINKRFAIAYTNMGHAHYEKGNKLTTSDKKGAADSFAKAIQALQTAKQNMRFFPVEGYDEGVHDTYYYTAISYQKLYHLTKSDNMLDKADLAWQEYFDFFPKSLENDDNFMKIKSAAQKYWDQIKEKM